MHKGKLSDAHIHTHARAAVQTESIIPPVPVGGKGTIEIATAGNIM